MRNVFYVKHYVHNEWRIERVAEGILYLPEEKGRNCTNFFVSYIHSFPEFNLPLTGSFTWLTPLGPYRASTCRERELTLDQIHTLLTTQWHGWPPRMRDQLNAGTTSETTRTWKTIHTIHTFILTRWIWKDDYDGQMIFGNLVGLKLPDICVTGEENSQETCADWESNPGSLRDRRACYRLLHSGGRELYNTFKYF